MLQIRDVLQVKFGRIDQAVELFTRPPVQALGYLSPENYFNVLTDVSGPMYTLVNEYVTDSLSEFEALRDRSYQQPGFEEWFRQFQLFIEGGRREYYSVEGAYASWSRPGMIVVRETYRTYKWQIRNAVALLQRYGALLVERGVGGQARILTDASGPMFQAVFEVETDSLSTWEQARRSVYQETEFQVWFVQLLTNVEAGRHDFYRVEYTGR